LRQQSNIGLPPNMPVKILVDEMCENWVETLRLEGHDDVRSVKNLRSEDVIQKGYRSVLEYAYENDMVLVTRNSKFGKDPATRKIQFVLPNAYLFKIALKKLTEYGGPAKEGNGAESSSDAVKVMVDQMYDGWDYRLRIEGYDAYSAKKTIRRNEDKIDDDYPMITYAREKGMIIITNDGRVGQDCRKAGIRCVVLDDEDLYGIVKGQLADLGRARQGRS